MRGRADVVRGRARALPVDPRVAIAGALLGAVIGCASPAPLPRPAADGAAGVSAEEIRQALFRVRYRGADGSGRVRLTVRTAGAARFALEAVDSFGRRLWGFRTEGDRSLFLDHRESAYCHLEGDVVVEVLALSECPVSTLPRVLFGDLPSRPAVGETLPADGEAEFEGVDGRSWTTRLVGGRPVSWTLWRLEEPLVWWQGDASGVPQLEHRLALQPLTTA